MKSSEQHKTLKRQTHMPNPHYEKHSTFHHEIAYNEEPKPGKDYKRHRPGKLSYMLHLLYFQVKGDWRQLDQRWFVIMDIRYREFVWKREKCSIIFFLDQN